MKTKIKTILSEQVQNLIKNDYFVVFSGAANVFKVMDITNGVSVATSKLLPVTINKYDVSIVVLNNGQPVKEVTLPFVVNINRKLLQILSTKYAWLFHKNWHVSTLIYFLFYICGKANFECNIGVPNQQQLHITFSGLKLKKKKKISQN